MAEVIEKELLRRGELVRTQLLPVERGLFQRWFSRWGEGYDLYEFAILLGPMVELPPDLDPGMRVLFERVTRLRVDFAAERGGRWTIFEIKPIARPSALGQLLAYESLWREELPGRELEGLAIITELVTPGMREVLDRFGVMIFAV